jgi:radical SAM protein with 4Fe4S-binding SPASM domain
MKENKITIDLADDIGYFNIKENEIRKQSFRIDKSITMWSGCQAGKCVMGIRANGDISGCLSIRDDNFIEGNIREKPLAEIWGGENAFSWNRKLTKDKLSGFCGKCQYANYCLGGCTGLKLTFSGSIYDNKYCSFRLAVEKEAEKINSINDIHQLLTSARKEIDNQQYQIAELYLSRAYTLEPENMEAMNLLGFVHYFLENYTESRKYNVLALAMDPQNAYAHKGLGLCLAALGDVPEGISHLKKAISFADEAFTDPYFDLAVVYDQEGMTEKAIETLEAGRKKAADFIKQSEEFYTALQKKLA